MEKEIRKMLCPKCLKQVRDIEATKQKIRRLKIKVVNLQERGKIKIKKIKI
jgi:hypothetical protein